MLLAGQFEFHRPSCFERGKRQNIFDEHFLLAAKAAADSFAEHPHLVERKIEQIGQRAPRQERHLRRGANRQHTIGIDPGDAAMGLQRGVLHPLGCERALIGHGRLCERCRDIAEFAVGFRDDVARRIADAMLRRLVAVDGWRARRNRLCGIDHGGENFIGDLKPAATFLGGGFGLGNHGCNLLPDEADDIVEHFCVFGIHPVFFVPRRREQPVRRVFEG